MRFQHPEYLAGLPAIILLVLLFIFILRWKKVTIKRIGDARLVKKLMQDHSPVKFFIKFSIVVLAFAAIIIGSANPQKPGKNENVNRSGIDVMVVLDVSKSMLATDIKPSRLEKAKQLLSKLLDKLQNDRIGIVVFAGRAYMQMPLTIDHGAAKMYIQDASPDVVPTQGTVIADALQMANAAFNAKEKKYKTILLISDGEDHDPNAAKVAQTLAQNGVVINTVGIGSPEGTTIIDPETKEIKKDAQGQTVISKLNEAELQQLSTATNGIYLRLDNMDDALITLSQQIDSIEKKSLNDSEFTDYNSYFQYLLGAALLLLLIEFILPERKKLSRDLGRLA
jgi:Ca-activated chloride channel family protein